MHKGGVELARASDKRRHSASLRICRIGVARVARTGERARNRARELETGGRLWPPPVRDWRGLEWLRPCGRIRVRVRSEARRAGLGEDSHAREGSTTGEDRADHGERVAPSGRRNAQMHEAESRLIACDSGGGCEDERDNGRE